MATKVAHRKERRDASTIIQHLHKLVMNGPWDLDIAQAMAVQGYDEVKWAEGQVVLAQLISCDRPVEQYLAAADQWYEEAITAAQRALVSQPGLLSKIGVKGTT
ncbi:MAG: hypothetical protein ACK2UU_22720 [Anaerolineae bacterium]|jgi:hypothetical protein